MCHIDFHGLVGFFERSSRLKTNSVYKCLLMVMISKKELDSLVAALNYCGLSALPEPYVEDSDRIWVSGIVKVRKSNGTMAYCVADNREYGSGRVHICKSFGGMARIVSIEGIYPASYLEGTDIPVLRTVNSMVSYLSSHGEDGKAASALLASTDANGEKKSDEVLHSDKERVRMLIARCAIRDLLKHRKGAVK